MKNQFIKTVSCVLVFVLTALMLSSCGVIDYFNSMLNDGELQNTNSGTTDGIDGNHSYHYLFPEGYTGGFRHQPGENIEYWWVETYEECLEAIELLKSHGSTFANDILLTYDGDLFDCKYCFMIMGVGATTEEIEWGDNPFDRYANNVYLNCYAFFDDVSIDELNYSLVSNYDTYLIVGESGYNLIGEITTENISISEWMKIENNSLKKHRLYKTVYYNDQEIMSILTQFYVNDGSNIEPGMTDECLKAIVESSKIINI